MVCTVREFGSDSCGIIANTSGIKLKWNVMLPIVLVAPLSDGESCRTWEVITDILHYLHIQVEFLLMCRTTSLDIHGRVALHVRKATTQNICSRAVHTSYHTFCIGCGISFKLGAPATSDHTLRWQRGRCPL